MSFDSQGTFGGVLRANAARFADRPALVDHAGRTTSFAALNTRSNRLANALRARGVDAGARVAILSRNRPEYFEAYGVAKAGMIPMPLNWRLAPSEIVRLLRHGAPQVILADASFAPVVDALIADTPSIAHRIAFDAPLAGWTAFETLLAEGSADEPDTLVRPDDILVLMYTSGTTGTPKGVEITHAAALDNAQTIARDALGLDPSDIALAVMPLFHVGGMWFHAFASVASGCTTVVLPEFDPVTVLATLARERVTNVHLVPTMIGALIRHPALATTDLSTLRLVFYAASSMPVDLLRRAMEAFGDCAFAQSYGSTEAGVVTTLLPADHRSARSTDADHRLASCGRPFPGRELRLVNDDDEEVGPGVTGEITVRHAGVMTRYCDDESATARALRGGWFHTGDMGRVDDDGYLTIVDRKNDLVITGGENVYPTEVEQALYRHRDVVEAAVFGIPDGQWVERVVAAVVLRGGAAVRVDELISELKQGLAAYKCPKQIFVVDALPKSAVGKILRHELRTRYGALTTGQSA